MIIKGTIKEADLAANKITVWDGTKDNWLYFEKKADTRDIVVGANITGEWFNPVGKKYRVLKNGFSVDGVTATMPREAPSMYKRAEVPSGQYIPAANVATPAPAYKYGYDTEIPGVSEPGLRFISNVVSAVIAKGIVTNTKEVTLWAKAAQDALTALKG